MTLHHASRRLLVSLCLALLLGGLVAVLPATTVHAANTLHVTKCDKDEPIRLRDIFGMKS